VCVFLLNVCVRVRVWRGRVGGDVDVGGWVRARARI